MFNNGAQFAGLTPHPIKFINYRFIFREIL